MVIRPLLKGAGKQLRRLLMPKTYHLSSNPLRPVGRQVVKGRNNPQTKGIGRFPWPAAENPLGKWYFIGIM
jgi:hypothetical protein